MTHVPYGEHAGNDTQDQSRQGTDREASDLFRPYHPPAAGAVAVVVGYRCMAVRTFFQIGDKKTTVGAVLPSLDIIITTVVTFDPLLRNRTALVDRALVLVARGHPGR